MKYNYSAKVNYLSFFRITALLLLLTLTLYACSSGSNAVDEEPGAATEPTAGGTNPDGSGGTNPDCSGGADLNPYHQNRRFFRKYARAVTLPNCSPGCPGIPSTQIRSK